ncbi:MAG: hypothetical protein GY776_15795 [Alteromonas sp.]|nr:hypothetical protein [Alteromonas sp.]
MAYGYDDRPRYTSLMDMIDGGGAGRSGDRFEGGGLLSLLANELFRPAGYEDRLRQRKNDTGRAVTTVVDELMRERAAMKEMDRQRGLQQDRFDTRDQQGASSFRAPVTPPTAAPSDYPDMSMPSIPGYTSPSASIASPVPEPKKSAYDNGSLIRDYLYFRDEQPQQLQDFLELVVKNYGIDGLRELQASVTPNMSYEGTQIVPTMTQPSVPDMARMASTDPRFSPVFAQDYGDYLEYMNTGRYPRG